MQQTSPVPAGDHIQNTKINSLVGLQVGFADGLGDAILIRLQAPAFGSLTENTWSAERKCCSREDGEVMFGPAFLTNLL